MAAAGSYDQGYYEAGRRGIEDTYAAGMAQNAFSRTLGQTRGNRGLDMMRSSFQRQLPTFTSQFGQRGFGGGGVKSGVMQRSMSNYLGDFTRDYGNAQNDLTDQMRQYDVSGAQLGAQRTSSLGDLELNRSREIAFAAQNIEALKGMLGGL
jgi:hypothetical protein